jgi:valyl-tRNA synthetase
MFRYGLTQIDLQGLVNIDTEIAKAEKKITAAKATMQKSQKLIANPDTPEEVKASTAESMKALETELAALQLSVHTFNNMRD